MKKEGYLLLPFVLKVDFFTKLFNYSKQSE